MATLPPIPPGICFGPFELDLAAGELRKGGTLVKLQPQPFQILQLLAERAGSLVTREEIQRHLWSESTFVDFEHGINFSINQIRGALADDAEKPRYIETLPRRGYRFIAAVRPASNGKNAAEIAPAIAAAPSPGKVSAELPAAVEKGREAPNEPATETLQPLNPEGEPRRSTRWKEMTATGVVVLSLTGVAFWLARRQPTSRNPSPELKLRQITTNPTENPVTGGAISPDGKYLAYVDAKGMHVKLIETGESRVVPQPEELSGKDVEWKIIQQWFPDSTRFLADAHRPGRVPRSLAHRGQVSGLFRC